MYKVPEKFYFRIHHVRPRFKSNLESVLFYMANKICQIGPLNRKEFKEKLNKEIFKFPGNSDSSEKTINNWRTEICSLFGFFIDNGTDVISGNIAKLLAQSGDIPRTFNYFLYKFQYPGAHIKNKAIAGQITNHIKFQPAKYILNVLDAAKKLNPEQAYISIGECTHCIFNDLRCTSINHEPFEKTWKRIINNRHQNAEYNTKGDITRYAKDILDYMTSAGLLNHLNNSYYMNDLASKTIKQIKRSPGFSEYDSMIETGTPSLDKIKQIKIDWFDYVNDIENISLSTDIFAYMNSTKERYNKDKENIERAIKESLRYENTKEVGDQGESIVYKYEIDNVNKNNRQDLSHLITFIPTPLAVGYDFNSIEPSNELRRYIEVKSTISSSKLIINSFHMTPNEVRTARTVGEHYFVYRLKIMKDKKPLLTIINNPIELIKQNKLVGDLNDTSHGLDVSYNPTEFKEVEI